MSMLNRLLPGDKRDITAVPWSVWAAGDDIGVWAGTYSGETVTTETVLGVAAAWSCATLIADVVSSQPVDEYRKNPDGARVKIEPESPIVAKPSHRFSRREWVWQAALSLAIEGNSIGQVVSRNPMGYAESVEWIPKRHVHIEQASPIGRPDYTVQNKPVHRDDIVHLRRYPQIGSAMGLSPLDVHKELFGIAQAARKYAAQWFGTQGGHPAALLINDNPIKEEVAAEAKRRWKRTGRDRDVRVLGSGWKYQQVQSTPADSELKETWDRVAVEVANAFRVPPEMIGAQAQGSSLTYTNRDQRAIDFLTFTMEPWFTIFEEFWSSELPNKRFAKINTGNLLRSDLLTRYRAHDLAIRMGLASPNERRKLEDMPPIDGRDEPLWPPYATAIDQTQTA